MMLAKRGNVGINQDNDNILTTCSNVRLPDVHTNGVFERPARDGIQLHYEVGREGASRGLAHPWFCSWDCVKEFAEEIMKYPEIAPYLRRQEKQNVRG